MSQPESTDQRAALDNCTGHVTCAASHHMSGCPSSPLGVSSVSGDPMGGNVPVVDPARVAAYAEAIAEALNDEMAKADPAWEFTSATEASDWNHAAARVVAVADAELAELRGDVEGLVRVAAQHAADVTAEELGPRYLDERLRADREQARAEVAEAESASRAEQIVALVDARGVWRERALAAEAIAASAPRVEIRTAIGRPTECKVWIAGVLRFDGTTGPEGGE